MPIKIGNTYSGKEVLSEQGQASNKYASLSTLPVESWDEFDPPDYSNVIILKFPFAPTTLDYNIPISYKAEDIGGITVPIYQGRQARTISFTARFADVWTQATSDNLPPCWEGVLSFLFFVSPQSPDIDRIKRDIRYQKNSVQNLKSSDNRRKKKYQREIRQRAIKHHEQVLKNMQAELKSLLPPPVLNFNYGSLSLRCVITALSFKILRMNPYTHMPSEMDVKLTLTEYTKSPTQHKEDTGGGASEVRFGG